MDFDKFEKDHCPVISIDGFLEAGKQFDLDITLPQDNRNVIYGIIKDCYGDPICDAVVKLIEVGDGPFKDERKPVSHTFTDKHGEFVFGPLCEHKSYELQIWANAVKHYKFCSKCEHEGKCLKGKKLDCDKKDHKPERPEK